MNTFTKILEYPDTTGNLIVPPRFNDFFLEENNHRLDDNNNMVPMEMLVLDGCNEIVFKINITESSRVVAVKVPWRHYCAYRGFERGDSVVFQSDNNHRIFLTAERDDSPILLPDECKILIYFYEI